MCGLTSSQGFSGQVVHRANPWQPICQWHGHEADLDLSRDGYAQRVGHPADLALFHNGSLHEAR